MEIDESMILRDMPVETRNYIIIDNITGKPIDQSNYTLTIDNDVIKKLNKLKKINEEKIKQASLREKYGNTNITSTFTPTNNAVFTPVYNDEYIDFHDFNDKKEESVELTEEKVEEVIEQTQEETLDQTTHAEIIKSDTLLDRVQARDPSIRQQEIEEQEKARLEAEMPKEELDYITSYEPNVPEEEVDNSANTDNSLFTPEMATLQQASEQIVKIDQDKLGQDIKAHKEQKKGTEKIKLDRMEVLSGKKIAWAAYILFFIPLLFKRKNRFVRLHANEGLELNIVEILSGLMIAQYFLLPKFVETISSTWSMISFIVCMVGAGLLGACALTIVISIITAMAGLQNQTPWLWKRRLIHVSKERPVE